MAVTTKKATATTAKAVPKTTKPKAPPKPKFGELGYTFNIQAKIIEVNPEDDGYNYPFIVELDLGNYEDIDNQGSGVQHFSYPDRKGLLQLASKNAPALVKSLKQDELNKAKAEVTRLTKELAAIK
jgi:hypothetical protein